MLNKIIELNVEGMSCSHCVNSIKTTLEDIKGIISVEVSLENKKVIVEYNPEEAKETYIKEAIEDEGYIVK